MNDYSQVKFSQIMRRIPLFGQGRRTRMMAGVGWESEAHPDMCNQPARSAANKVATIVILAALRAGKYGRRDAPLRGFPNLRIPRQPLWFRLVRLRYLGLSPNIGMTHWPCVGVRFAHPNLCAVTCYLTPDP
jgi:hypothetical protein